MYSIFEQLLLERGVTTYKVSKDTGIAQSVFSSWKSGISTPKTDKMQKIADYFGVSLEFITTGIEKDDKEVELNAKDERDISKRLEKTLKDLENSQEALMFDGVILDDNTKELLKASLENSLRIAKIHAKEKFTPKKYKDNK